MSYLCLHMNKRAFEFNPERAAKYLESKMGPTYSPQQVGKYITTQPSQKLIQMGQQQFGVTMTPQHVQQLKQYYVGTMPTPKTLPATQRREYLGQKLRYMQQQAPAKTQFFRELLRMKPSQAATQRLQQYGTKAPTLPWWQKLNWKQVLGAVGGLAGLALLLSSMGRKKRQPSPARPWQYYWQQPFR